MVFTTKRFVVEAIQYKGTQESYIEIKKWSELPVKTEQRLMTRWFASNGSIAYFAGESKAKYELVASDWLVRMPGETRTDYSVFSNSLFELFFEQQKNLKGVFAALHPDPEGK